jgi:hypothetical protein
MKTPKLKLEKGSRLILMSIMIVPLVISLLDKFGILTLGPYIPPILVLLSSIFISNEILRSFSKKKLINDPFKIFGLTVVLLSVLGAVFNIIGFEFLVFNFIQGVLLILMIFYSIVEALR